MGRSVTGWTGWLLGRESSSRNEPERERGSGLRGRWRLVRNGRPGSPFPSDLPLTPNGSSCSSRVVRVIVVPTRAATPGPRGARSVVPALRVQFRRVLPPPDAR